MLRINSKVRSSVVDKKDLVLRTPGRGVDRFVTDLEAADIIIVDSLFKNYSVSHEFGLYCHKGIK